MPDAETPPEPKPARKELLPEDYVVTPEMTAQARREVEEDEAKKMPLKVFTPFPSRD